MLAGVQAMRVERYVKKERLIELAELQITQAFFKFLNIQVLIHKVIQVLRY